ncbi:MAG: ABC transporter ATP-binding protein [Actinomycetota bacterium]|nr:ABC transporter ATP-binding protein [Actinomycetota bacterium]
MSGAAVECVGVWKSFGKVHALRATDLALATGTLTAVLGPSGCGKTTLLRAIAGFERIDAGRIRVSGQDVAGPGLHVPPERRRVTIVPQEQALFPHLTVAGNVGYGVRRGPERDEAVEAMLELAGLSGLGSRMPHELSGGQQQRVALARALAPKPTVVLLDEPFGSLDAALRDEIRSEVAGVLRASAATSLLVTHDQEEALSMADSVAVMRSGEIVQHGPPQDIYRRPADLWVANFVGRANILEGRVTGAGKVECALGPLELGDGPDDGAVDVVIRPEQLQIATIADGDDGPLVENRLYFGHDVVVSVCLPTGERLLVRLPSAEPVPVGSRVSVVCREPVLAFPVTGRQPVVDAGE